MKLYDTKYGQVYQGDCLEIMKTFDDNSIETVITDPPAGINFMGKGWDHHKGGREKWIDYMAERFREALRITVPGGIAIVWALPRTAHWTATALENAGWYIDTKLYHLFGSGWPKGGDISKQIDNHFGCVREKIENPIRNVQAASQEHHNHGRKNQVEFIEPIPVHPQAQKWNGYRTQLKPMAEEWIVCRKPVDKNFVNNALEWGVAGYNVDGCRVERGESTMRSNNATQGYGGTKESFIAGGKKCRYPGNVIVDDEVAGELDERTGLLVSGHMKSTKRKEQKSTVYGEQSKIATGHEGSSGGASRYFTRCSFQEVDFFYGGKATSNEKNDGLEALAETDGNKGSPRRDGKIRGEIKTKNVHPTVKSLELCRWLCNLSMPPDGGTVLDMFAGTMSIPIAAYQTDRKFIAIEENREYCDIGVARLKAIMAQKKFDW